MTTEELYYELMDYEYQQYLDYTLEQYIDSVVTEKSITTTTQLAIRCGLEWDYEFSPSVLLRIAQNKVEYQQLRVERCEKLNK